MGKHLTPNEMMGFKWEYSYNSDNTYTGTYYSGDFDVQETPEGTDLFFIGDNGEIASRETTGSQGNRTTALTYDDKNNP